MCDLEKLTETIRETLRKQGYTFTPEERKKRIRNV